MEVEKMKKLVRPYHDRKLAGVLGGISSYFNVDSTIIRLIFIALLVFTGIMPLALIYLIAVFVMPNEGMKP
jgi:phage shock protein C